MFKHRLALGATALFIICLVSTSVARAQGRQKFVSARNGSDSNSCTINLPCRTFAAAILQVRPRGEIIALDAGDYGPVTITKTVTIAGPAGANAGISVGSGPAVTIDAAVSDIIVLRGLTINGSGLRGPLLIPEAPGILLSIGNITGRGTALIRVSNSTVNSNAVGLISAEGGGILSRGNNTIEGNTNDGSATGMFPAK